MTGVIAMKNQLGALEWYEDAEQSQEKK